MKERIVPIFFVLGTGILLVLNSRGQLIGPNSVTGVLFGPDDPNTPTMGKTSTFFLAFFVYLLIVSFLSETEAEWFTGVLALGALMENQARRGGSGDSVLAILTKGINASPIGAGN